MSLNRVFLLGRLGADPELRYTSSQLPVGSFRLATNERRKNADGEWEEQTEWHSIVTFGKTAENCSQYLSKGREVFVEGQLRTSKWQDQEGKDRYRTEIIAQTVTFVGGKGGSLEIERTASSSQGDAAPLRKSAAKTESAEVSFDEDDIPF